MKEKIMSKGKEEFAKKEERYKKIQKLCFCFLDSFFACFSFCFSNKNKQPKCVKESFLVTLFYFVVFMLCISDSDS